MKTILKSLLWLMTIAILCLLFAGSSCDKPEPKPEPNPVTNYPIKISFTEYSLTETSCEWVNFESNKAIIVNNDEEMSGYIVCSDGDYPKINFSIYSLILARSYATSGIRYIEIDLLKEAENKYALYVSIHTSMTTEAPPWLISIITPKINNEDIISLNVQQIND